MKRSVTNRLAAFCSLAVLAYILLYLFSRPLLPEQLVRHAGPDGLGYSPLWITVLIVGAIATLSLSIGVLVYRDFSTLGHWFPGPKAIVVYFLAAGFGILGLGIAMIITVLGRDAEDIGSLPVVTGLLALLVVFALSAGLLSKLLPRAKQETLGG